MSPASPDSYGAAPTVRRWGRMLRHRRQLPARFLRSVIGWGAVSLQNRAARSQTGLTA